MRMLCAANQLNQIAELLRKRKEHFILIVDTVLCNNASR